MLNDKEKKELYEALFFMNIKELKAICNFLKLSYTGGKGQTIERIKYFIEKGKIIPSKEIPIQSQARYNIEYPLSKNTLILFGSYKNDTKTRDFFKKIIGPYFHFTAFGNDWIKKRWYEANPPTYQEFAQMWQQEYEKRKSKKAQPKKEWAYINYLQEHSECFPQVSAQELRKSWHKTRTLKVKHALALLKKIK